MEEDLIKLTASITNLKGEIKQLSLIIVQLHVASHTGDGTVFSLGALISINFPT
jgi:hypothetical protein